MNTLTFGCLDFADQHNRLFVNGKEVDYLEIGEIQFGDDGKISSIQVSIMDSKQDPLSRSTFSPFCAAWFSSVILFLPLGPMKLKSNGKM